MNKTLLLTLTLASLVSSSALIAQPMGRGQGRGGCAGRCGAQYMRAFDAKTIQTLTGDVARVATVNMRGHGRMQGVHAWVKSGEGEIEVHLGPAWFIKNQDLQLAAGDRIEVRGSRVTIDGKPAVIAIEVRRGADVLKLRDEAGVPVWVAWRAGPGPKS